MDEQVLELVMYKVKADQIKNFEESKLHQLRDLIKEFEGLISYETFGEVNEEGLYVDQVLWRDLGCATRAAEKVKLLENDEPFASIFSVFEEMKFCQHFKKVA